MIPPAHDGAYVACLEDVLAVYQRPLDPARPVVCMDEQPVQLVKETRAPVPAAPGRPRRVDYEYERAGTANLFVFSEPLTGWRRVRATPRRPKVDWATEIHTLLTDRYANAAKVILVLDNLNTHTLGARYDAFPPAEARRLAERLELHYTPKHGSVAQHCRERAERVDHAMSRPAPRHARPAGAGGARLGDLAQ